MSQNPPAAGRPYFDRVDALRGLGALAVAGFHFSGCVLHGTTLLPQVPWADVGPVQNAVGRLGVTLVPGHLVVIGFFVISGFVLRLSLGHGPRTMPAAAAKLAIARLFRFYPIVAAGVVAAALLAPDLPPAGQVVANVFLLDVSLNLPLWSLQVELLMVPVILALFALEQRAGPRAVAVVAVAATGLAFAPRWAVWSPLSTTLFSFVLGMLVPTIGRRFAAGLSRRAATWCVIGAVAVLLAASPVLGAYSRFTEIVGGYAAAAALSLVAYRPDLPILRGLDGRWLRRLGEASGSYYVLHMATVPAVLPVAAAVIPSRWSEQAPGVVGIGVIAAWLVVIAPVMVCVSRLVEETGIALGRRVVRALGLGVRSANPPPAPVKLPERRATWPGGLKPAGRVGIIR